MKKMLLKFLVMATALALLLGACAAQAETAESAAQKVNILFLLYEGTGNPYFANMLLLLSLDPSAQSIRVVNFYYITQIDAVTRKGEALSIPMTYLGYCDTPEIVRALETAFGVAVDRYLIYTSPTYERALRAFDLLCPVTLDIPETLMGSQPYTSVNGTMKMFAESMNADYAPLKRAGVQELGPLALISYLTAFPPGIWTQGSWYDILMGDYAYRDTKDLAAIEALRPNIARMDREAALAFWNLIVEGQDTNITGEDIAAWSEIPFNFPEDAYYFSAPGVEGVEMLSFNTEVLSGGDGYEGQMFAYDRAALAEAIRSFLGAE